MRFLHEAKESLFLVRVKTYLMILLIDLSINVAFIVLTHPLHLSTLALYKHISHLVLKLFAQPNTSPKDTSYHS